MLLQSTRIHFYKEGFVKYFLYLTTLILLFSCNSKGPEPKANDGTKDGAASTPLISFSVTNTYPHDTSSFTEGLLIYKGKMYESTGPDKESKLLEVDLKTGKPIRRLDLDPQYFGEGIVILHDTIYQWTYTTKKGFMYTLKDFKKIKEFNYDTQGWGMTTNGKEIIASDGTSYLYYYEPSTFRLLRKQEVREAGSLSYNLNELEYIDGYIYANQWQQPYILKIDPASGQIVAKADLSELTNRIKTNYPFADFLNGIAYDSATKKTYVTGKNWPELYEVQFSR